jgi:hypothetical protein
MTLQLIPSDFLIYEENLIFFLSVYSTATDMITVYRFESTPYLTDMFVKF